MKKALLTFLQFILFYLIFFAGSLLDPFHLKWFISHPSPTLTHYYVPDGLLLMVALYILLLLVEALRKRFTSAAPWTSLAFLLALAFGLLSKFGFATHDLLG